MHIDYDYSDNNCMLFRKTRLLTELGRRSLLKAKPMRAHSTSCSESETGDPASMQRPCLSPMPNLSGCTRYPVSPLMLCKICNHFTGAPACVALGLRSLCIQLAQIWQHLQAPACFLNGCKDSCYRHQTISLTTFPFTTLKSGVWRQMGPIGLNIFSKTGWLAVAGTRLHQEVKWVPA